MYLDYDGFRALTTLPDQFVCEVEDVAPGWVEGQLEYWARWIDSRLRKRYATPFAAFNATPPTPPAVQGWLSRIVTVRVWIKRGVDPNDLQFGMINDDAIAAMAEVQEAADSVEGKFDLPLRTDQDGSAINRGNPRSYSEASPYVWTDVQSSTGSNEDDAGSGSSV